MHVPSAPEALELPDPADPARIVRVALDRPSGTQRAPAVLLVHGFKGFGQWGFFPELARRLAGRGILAARVNVSGCGVGADLEHFTELEAFERDTPSRQQEDLERALAAVAALDGVDPARLGLFGHSRGGAVALLVAARHPEVRAVATWAAIDRYDTYDDATKREWRARGYLPVPNARTGQVLRAGVAVLDDLEQNAARLDVLAAAGRVTAPTLVVHGSADETVDPACGERIAAALARGRLLAIEDGGHTLGARHPLDEVPATLERALAATVAHFAQTLAPESAPGASGRP